MVEELYAKYSRFVETCSVDDFKSHPDYRYMLEHATPEFGRQYWNLLLNESSLTVDDIRAFVELNDRVGNTIRSDVNGISMSPASILYLYQAQHILKNAPRGSSFVELGCGYGGLCLAIDFVSKKLGIPVKSYAMVDLPHPSRLQQDYLDRHTLGFPVSFHNSTHFGADVPGEGHYFISVYCFSEIGASIRETYIKTLLPKTSAGFIVWNHIPLYDFGKPNIRWEPERPLTGRSYGVDNMFVTFG